MTKRVSLSVNDVPIELNYFAEEFVDNTVGGMVASLEGTGEIESLHLSIEGDTVTLNLNNAGVPTSLFVSKIIRNTVTGMVSSLKGVSAVDRLSISIKR